MPQIKSAIKRVTTSRKANEVRSAQKSSMRTAVKAFLEAKENNAENSAELYTTAIRAIDMAASKGLIHANKAARDKSRLTLINNR